ncbi:MAG: ferredoxin [Nitrospirota bacterium]
MGTKFKINLDDCTGCGACEDACPQVFKVVDEKSFVNNSAVDKNLAAAMEAKNSCPDKAIVNV